MATEPISDIALLQQVLPLGKKLLGVDVGSKTLGLALSDIYQRIGTPLLTLKRTKFTQDAARLIEVIEAHEVALLVVGLPLHMNGQEGKACQSVRQFVRNLQKIHPIPVFLQDERLSTNAAQEALHHTQAKHKTRREKVDAVAASFILQATLDRMHRDPLP